MSEWTRAKGMPREGKAGKARGKTVRFADPKTQAGFTQIPNAILRNAALSVPARLSYAMLASFAWEDESCWPGQVKVAGMLGVSDRQLRRYLTELKDVGLLVIHHRGLSKPNRYVLKTRMTGHPRPVKTGHQRPTKKTQKKNSKRRGTRDEGS